ncbi:MAG: radical SAM protein [Bacilli bacterium]|nr:radical SAM protein [Bacilli bacterium]
MNKKLKEYIENINGVIHTTFNPKGPGVVRLHLIPPKKIKLGIPWVVIINGQDILPISCGWAILLKIFIENINKTYGKVISDEEMEKLINKTITKMSKLFPKTDKELFKEDLSDIIKTFEKIAIGEAPDIVTGFMSLKDYSKHMRAPHRMDLMVSSMCEKGHWHCNQKCLHCYAGHQEYAIKEELSTDEWKHIIDECKNAYIPQLTFTGGEPTLRSDLVELVEYASWFVTRVNTNGILLTKELCASLYEASLDSIQVTLYSHEEHIHNLLVGANTFQKTIEGIKNAICAGLNVSINTPLCSLNKDYLELVKFAHEKLGVDYFTCSGIIITGNATKEEAIDTQLSKEEITNILKNVTEYAHANELGLNFTSPGWVDTIQLKELNLNVPSCGACLSNMAIAPDGTVVPCQSWLNNHQLGNLLHDDFKTIWNSKLVKQIRKSHLKYYNVCPLNEKTKQGECSI